MHMVDTLKKEIRDMNVMELIEKMSESTKIAALNLWGTNRECTNIAIDECAQDAVDNIGIAFRVMEMLTETNNTRSAKDIVSEMLDNDDESLTDVSEYDSDSDSD